MIPTRKTKGSSFRMVEISMSEEEKVTKTKPLINSSTTLAKKILSESEKELIQKKIEGLTNRQIELVDIIQNSRNDTEIEKCVSKVGELKMIIDSLKDQLKL